MGTSTTSRKQQEIKARDEFILSAASQLFSAQGYHGTTMQAIADSVGYSKGTIYQHYTCKEDVLAKLFLQCGEDLQDRMQKVLSSKPDVRTAILLITGVFLQNAKDVPGIAGNVTLVQSPDFIAKLAVEYQEQLEESERIILSHIISVFSNCENFNCDQAKSAAFGWWSMQLGVQSVMISGWDIEAMGFKTPEQHIIESLNIFIDGLGIPIVKPCETWADVTLKMQQILEPEEL
jgi:AcrR family transcriptional regulator